MGRVFKEDIYILGLLNIYKVNNGIMVTLSEDTLNNYYDVVEQNLEDMNSEANCLKSVIFSGDMDCYSVSRRIDDKLYFTLNNNSDILRTMIFRQGLLPLDILYASMKDNALNCLGLQLKGGHICKKSKYYEEDFKNNQNILNLQEEKQKRISLIRELIDKYPILEIFTKEYKEETEYREFMKEHINDFRLGKKEEDNVVTSYLDSHLEGGIKQKNLDIVLDLMDEYVEVVEATTKEKQGPIKKLVPNNKK